VKQIKVFGLSLVATFAMAAVAAGSVGAETIREHSTWQAFANCPFHTPPFNEEYEELTACVWGTSSYKERWQSKAQQEQWETSHGQPEPGLLSQFTAGKVTVALKMPILLRGGFEIPIEGEEILWIAAREAPTIQPVPQKTIPITKGVNRSLLSPKELERYEYYVHTAKQTKTYATVELAGPAEQIHLNLSHQLEEEGTAFVFPVKVKLSNPFLGENCYVGSDSSPIKVPFTTGQDGELHGKLGLLTTEHEGGVLVIWGDTLVSSSFSAPGVEGCGVEGGADEAVDSALGLPSATGNTSVLNGVLRLAGSEEVEAHL
jgi:hypothetical protein